MGWAGGPAVQGKAEQMSGVAYAGVEQREARARAAAKLPSPCPRCQGIVTSEMVWHADHWPVSRAQARAAGIPLGELDVWPAHKSCNEKANGAEARTGQPAALAGSSIARPQPRKIR